MSMLAGLKPMEIYYTVLETLHRFPTCLRVQFLKITFKNLNSLNL